MIRTRHTRRGVTLVEMMVAAAMCILGMWLLTWLFQQGQESFRQARALAELTSQERMVTTVLTRDLRADHFLDEDTKPNRGRRLSDQLRGFVDGTGYTAPRGGYFRAISTAPANGGPLDEGFDSDGFRSTRSVDHVLQFTVLLPGGPNHLTFSAEVPAGSATQYFGTAAEVMYYLVETDRTAGGVQLYDLYRHQRLCARTTDDASAYATPASDPNAHEVMVAYGGQMRTFGDLTVPNGYPNSVRLVPKNPTGPPQTPLPAGSFRYGEDKLISNVLSFEVKFTGSSSGVAWPAPFPGNTDYPYDFLPYDGRIDTFSTRVANWNVNTVADTANPSRPMKPLRITGAMIRIRAYEPRTRSTRQTTLTIDL